MYKHCKATILIFMYFECWDKFSNFGIKDCKWSSSTGVFDSRRLQKVCNECKTWVSSGDKSWSNIGNICNKLILIIIDCCL